MPLEGTGQKPRNIRGKSGVQIATPKGPTVRSRVVARVTPKKNTATALAGIGGLGMALSGFFKQAGQVTEAVAQIEQANSLAEIKRDNVVELAKIKQKNKDLAFTGTAKALSGEKLTEEEAGLHASLDAFENTIGQKIGWNLVAEWDRHMAQLPSTVGTQEAWEAFIKDRLKNSKIKAGLGTGNPRVDVAIMAVLERGTAKGRRVRQLTRAKGEMNTKALDVSANMAAMLTRDGSNFSLSDFIRDLKAVDPMNAHKAEANALSMLVAWAGANRGKGTQIIQIFEANGIDKRIGTVAWAKIENRIVLNQLNLRTIKGRAGFEAYMSTTVPKLGFIPITKPGEFAKVYQEAMIELTRLSHQVGQQGPMYAKAVAALNAHSKKFGAAFTKMIKVEAAVTAVMRGAKAGRIIVPDVRNVFSEVMRRGNPRGVANWLLQAKLFDRYDAVNTINATEKAAMTHSLSTFDSKFGDTMRTLMAFSALNKGNEASVLNLLDSSVHTIYKAAVSDFRLGKTWDEIASRIAKERKEGGSFDHTFKQMTEGSGKVGTLSGTGDKDDAQTKIMGWLNDSLKEKYKGLDIVNDQTLRILSHMALREWAILKQGDNAMTAERAIGLFVEAVVDGGRLTLVPGGGEKVQLSFTRQPRHGTPLTVGVAIDVTEPPRTAVGFGTALVSPNRTVENTIKTYQDDRKDIVRFAFAGLETKIGGGITSESLSLDANHLVAGPRGLYVIKSNGQPITFQPGQTVTIGGKEITLPNNVAEAAVALNKLDAFEGAIKRSITAETKKIEKGLKASVAQAAPLHRGPLTLTARQKTMNQRIVYLVVGNLIILTYRPGFVEDPAKRPPTGRELADMAEKRAAAAKKAAEDFRSFDTFVGG